MRFTRRTTISAFCARGLAGLGLSCLLLADTAAAFTAPARGARSGPEMADGAAVRGHRTVRWNLPPARAAVAHAALARSIGATETLWDRATGVPVRVWGSGVPAPGSVASPEVAARGARALLREHLAVLAPGASLDDLVLVGNHVGGGVRSVGFRQHHRGRPVLGGQVSVRFKADRLVAIASEALPDVRVALTDAPISAAVARARASAWVLADAAGRATAGAVTGPFIRPIVGDERVHGYREVLRVQVDADAPLGRWSVDVDAATGEPVAREQTLRFATGTIEFAVPDRGPQGPRAGKPAPRLAVVVNGVPAVTDALGRVELPEGFDAAVALGVEGELVRVSNKAGEAAATDVTLVAQGVAQWGAPDDEALDAQLAAYIHANIVKERVRGIAPDFAYLDQKLQVRVNIADVCNAFSEGDAINFFAAGEGCENTGRIADIVYHEFGHSVHQQAIIEGVGNFDGALSEGISDYLSATITDDPGLGRGFFVDAPDGPLREMDPAGKEWRWPEDVTGEVHQDGLIIAGALWDLRELLRAKLGDAEGIALTDRIWFESIRRASDIPTMYPEALLVDDDDGDLANGTPNECEINRAFYAHGLLTAANAGTSVKLGAATPAGTPVALAVGGMPKACVDLKPVAATLRWRSPGAALFEEVAMLAGVDEFTALLPGQPDNTVVEYQVVSELADASELAFPINPADPWYQLYTGPVTELYCTGFEGAAGVDGWELGTKWAQGAPTGQAGDPDAAFAGADVLGINLGGPYSPSSFTKVTGPVIDTRGFSTVRLQYRRWLGVEDSHFDKATIRINGLPAWRNFDSKQGDNSGTHHQDREWRFHDIDITPGVIDGVVQVGFELSSDQGLELAGWNVDEVCVVGVDAEPAPLCGNGKVDIGEECDGGPDCGPTCEDQSQDTEATPTSGEDGTGDGESDSDSDASGPGELDDEGCGCRSSAPASAPGLALGLLLLGLRRRRRA